MKNSGDSGDGDQSGGRVSIDDRGRAIWQPDPGVEADQAVDELLSADFELADTRPYRVGRAAEQGFDPYSSGVVKRTERRRLASDMRKLSAQIVASRAKSRR